MYRIMVVEDDVKIAQILSDYLEKYGIRWLDKIMDIANRHNVKVLEDACQAVGGSHKGRRLASIGHVGAYSFNYHKIISCGEGGALLSRTVCIPMNPDWAAGEIQIRIDNIKAAAQRLQPTYYKVARVNTMAIRPNTVLQL